MHFLKTELSCILCFFFSLDLFAGGFPHSIKIEVESGYSGTYLPYNKGFLTNQKVDTSFPLVKPSPPNTIADKFDLTIESMNLEKPQSFGFSDYLYQYAYNEKAQYWEGFCDKWSYASTEPAIKELMNNTDGLICKDVQFSRSELRELFTIFMEDKTEGFAPEYLESVPSERIAEFIQASRDQIGITYFRPHIFHRKLIKFMREGGRANINIDAGPEIWNQPVVKINAQVKIVKENELVKFPLPFFFVQVRILQQ